MSVHEQFADDLSLYAIGALSGEERREVEKHLDECTACRQELEKIQGNLALLAFSVSGPKPPARSRKRLLAAIAKEPRKADLPRATRMNWWNVLGWGAAAAVIVIGILLAQQNSDLRGRVASLQTRSSKQDEQLLEANQLLAALTSPDAEHFTLVTGNTRPQPQGKVIYVRGSGTLAFFASNMPAIPAQKAYELWLIPATGGPIPAGLFKPDKHGVASVVRPQIPIGVEAKAFAITIEPESGSPAPTSQPIMIGNGA